MTQQDCAAGQNIRKRVALAQAIACLTAIAIVVPVEVERAKAAAATQGGILAWVAGINSDTTLYLLLLLVLPVFWCLRHPILQRRPRWLAVTAKWLAERPGAERSCGRTPLWITWAAASLVGLASLAVSVGIASYRVDRAGGERFGNLPPAYHDEYSYLFQAKTFLAGHLSFPSHPSAPQLFDQMHVLNEGRFASRYFPGVGAWIAPFLALDRPLWGHFLAGALTAMLVWGTGRELAGNGAGLLAGLLTALSPGMGLFSNLLLSHHPTLVGLSLFLYFVTRGQRTECWWDGGLAGLGLSYAMLCRPMTAAGVGLPFGVWLLWWIIRGNRGADDGRWQSRLRFGVAVGTPVIAGFLVVFGYNHATTGSGWTTPYQLYTDTYTPRHVYGFNNVVRGERRLGPRVLGNYDRWAENLTPALAVENVRNRLIASWQWTLGVVPLAVAAVLFLVAGSEFGRRWWLIAAAIVSLHVVHIPYWYDGIMHYHYVFESGPLWCLVFAGTTGILVRHWRQSERPWLPVWWAGVIGASLLVTYSAIDPFWRSARMTTAIEQVAFSRSKYQRFHDQMAKADIKRPALVFIEPDPADRHIDLVVNDPDLRAPVLYARFPRHGIPAEVLRQFSDRHIYHYRAKDGRLTGR